MSCVCAATSVRTNCLFIQLFILMLVQLILTAKVSNVGKFCLEWSRCGLGNRKHVSARQAAFIALKRWSTTDKRWNKNVVFLKVTRLIGQTHNSKEWECLVSLQESTTVHTRLRFKPSFKFYSGFSQVRNDSRFMETISHCRWNVKKARGHNFEHF